MSATAAGDRRISRRRTFARRALVLGVASIPLFIAGFGWVPFAGEAGLAAALASLVYGALALRRPRAVSSTAMATIGVVFSLLTVFAAIYLIVAFTTGPGD
jgi:hypothetical protein